MQPTVPPPPALARSTLKCDFCDFRTPTGVTLWEAVSLLADHLEANSACFEDAQEMLDAL